MKDRKVERGREREREGQEKAKRKKSNNFGCLEKKKRMIVVDAGTSD